MEVPFNKQFLTGKEKEYIADAISLGRLYGNGVYTKKCHSFIEENFGIKKALLTSSCTKAIEMAYVLCGIKEGDEVIMPSFAFVSAASSLMVHGGVPVFVDVKEETLNIDENKILEKITPRTKAILVVHYAGNSANMDEIMRIAKENKLLVIEDAAQAIGSKYKGKYLGSIGDFGAYSFHGTKNIISGEGGALLINNDNFFERAEIIWEKGTNRNKFLKGQVDKYTWVDVGSSYLSSELQAAFLLAQLERYKEINSRRKIIYEKYVLALKDLVSRRKLKILASEEGNEGNYHLMCLFLESEKIRDGMISFLKGRGISAYFHFVPLHNSPKGKELGYKDGDFLVTEKVAANLVRLPLYTGMLDEEIEHVINGVKSSFNDK